VDRLFCFEEGRLERFEGNYSSYLERQPSAANASQAATAKPIADPAATSEAAPSPAKPAAAKTRRRSFKETRELEQLDADLPRWEEQRGALEAQMAAGGSDYAALEALSEELSTLLERIARGEERWLELSELAG
jgi:ATP-binding cassette subfamily F protein uup